MPKYTEIFDKVRKNKYYFKSTRYIPILFITGITVAPK